MTSLASAPAGPHGGQVACAACGAGIDPLRAGHVAIFNSRFHFFCDFAVCRRRFVARAPGGEVRRALARPRPVPAPPPPEPPRPEIDAVLPPVRPAIASAPDEPVPERIAVDEAGDLIEPVAVTSSESSAAIEPGAERRELGMLLVALSLIAGALAMALELAGPVRLVQVARVVLIAVGSSALLGRAVTTPIDAARPHWIVTSLPPLLGTLVAGWALLVRDAELVARASFLAGTVLTVAAINVWLVGLAATSVALGRRWVEQRLDVPARRVVGEVTQLSPKERVFDVKRGEHVVVEAGETVPVDLTIVEGEVEVLPWVGAATRARRGVGDVVVAGSRIGQGQLRGACTWSGDERALARPLLNPRRRPDVHADVARWARQIAERWAPAAALVAAGACALSGWSALEVGMVTVAVYAAFANLAVGSVPAMAVASGVRAALSRGVVYNDARAWESCAKVAVAVFCARGTLLRGEPELVEIEVYRGGASGSDSADEVLALAAGALASERGPAAIALRRAARNKGVVAEAVRNARSFGGAGVTAVASTGEALCVGSRALLLERRVSMAIAEQRIYELEASGRTVVLVAKAGRLLGLLALQDGLRAGARAAVQHLMDAKIEPVLMSADTRETCEALGRALDIDHLRAEVFDEERAAAVERIKDTGAMVAVLGHSPHDDEPLAAADASIALASAGGERDDFAVSLASDDVRDASLALALAHRARRQAGLLLGLTLGPAAFGSLVAILALLPPEYAPMAQLVGALTAVWQLRSFERG